MNHQFVDQPFTALHFGGILTPHNKINNTNLCYLTSFGLVKIYYPHSLGFHSSPALPMVKIKTIQNLIMRILNQNVGKISTQMNSLGGYIKTKCRKNINLN